jgi:hypothetical protein
MIRFRALIFWSAERLALLLLEVRIELHVAEDFYLRLAKLSRRLADRLYISKERHFVGRREFADIGIRHAGDFRRGGGCCEGPVDRSGRCAFWLDRRDGAGGRRGGGGICRGRRRRGSACSDIDPENRFHVIVVHFVWHATPRLYWTKVAQDLVLAEVSHNTTRTSMCPNIWSCLVKTLGCSVSAR